MDVSDIYQGIMSVCERDGERCKSRELAWLVEIVQEIVNRLNTLDAC